MLTESFVAFIRIQVAQGDKAAWNREEHVRHLLPRASNNLNPELKNKLLNLEELVKCSLPEAGFSQTSGMRPTSGGVCCPAASTAPCTGQFKQPPCS